MRLHLFWDIVFDTRRLVMMENAIRFVSSTKNNDARDETDIPHGQKESHRTRSDNGGVKHKAGPGNRGMASSGGRKAIPRT